MIPAILYFAIILFFIWKNGLFGVFKSSGISNSHFLILFFLKFIGVFAFYFVFEKIFGGINQYDAGHYMKDSGILYQLAWDSPLDYLKVLFGLQDESQATILFKDYLSRTDIWDEGRSWRILFNDNRTVIRFHSLIHFISFGSIYVHALISCLLGFIGLHLIYNSFSSLISKYIVPAFYIIVLMPNLWFFSAGILKEPLLIFNMGMVIHLINDLFQKQRGVFAKLFFVACIVFFVLILKPVITGSLAVCYFTYLFSEKYSSYRKSLIYLSVLIVMSLVFILSFWKIMNVSPLTYLNKKQMEFQDQMKGGIFLKDRTKFVRMPYDYNTLKIDSSQTKDNVTIRAHEKFIYWEDTHQQDTLFCKSNLDTITRYSIVYIIIPANTGYDINTLSITWSGFKAMARAVVMSGLMPLKFNSAMNSIVSLENICLSFLLVFSLIGLVFKTSRNTMLFLLSFILFVFIIIGIATPNTGAIIRYRIVAIPFIVIGAFITLNAYYESKRIR